MEGLTLNTMTNMVIDKLKHEIITSQIDFCQYDATRNRYNIRFINNKQEFPYSTERISWLKNPKSLNPALYHISRSDNDFNHIATICVFEDCDGRYWHICFENGTERDYFEYELEIVKSCLDDVTSKNVFEYLSQSATISNLKGDDGTKLLPEQYKKISTYVGENTVLAAYLNPANYKVSCSCEATPIFPFGCNASQYKAVKAALENQISIIQGPPGTGKTQTILNIIANLLISGKTVQVVSNNNSATKNVLEKLSLEKYGMDFLVASLGCSDNKKDFIKNQTGCYPDLSSWKNEVPEERVFMKELKLHSEQLNNIYLKQEELALAKQELGELLIEEKYFEQYSEEINEKLTQYKIRRKLKSEQLLQLWQECQYISDIGKKLTILFKLKSCVIYGIADWDFYKEDITLIVNALQRLFYQTRIEELQYKIQTIKKELDAQDAQKLSSDFTENSMKYLKNVLYDRYGGADKRKIFVEDDLWKNKEEVQKEYPIVLSTTFSSRSSLCKDAIYDYIIMDEASQVDVATGALAISSAKNAVIVGDTKQLANVVTEKDAKKADVIFDSFNINESYRYSQKSFLQSVCELLPMVPQTLLREHYRCHPKIINFCNHKFYNGELVIMSTDDSEKDVLSVVKTVVGNHKRGRKNQRQIDSIKEEILPSFLFEEKDIGIIAPYNDQVNALRKELSGSEVEIDTVHKFQGREKDAIILTTVDNKISEFADKPDLLNVAISRAKKNFCLVVSGNEQPQDSNIFDLMSYIEYNNFCITESKLYSVFDYLYKQYTESRLVFLEKHKKISIYDSENLMYGLIKEILEEIELTTLDVICHLPLRMLIKDKRLLNEEECRYAMHSATHLDFLIYNRVTKKPVLAIEVDGVGYHKDGTRQAERDKMKNHILDLYKVPYLRFSTDGSREKERIVKKLKELNS